MPSDKIVESPSKNWKALVETVTAIRDLAQTEEDTWCIIGVNGAHILTVWSKPHTAADKWVRPSNHAEERLVTIYPDAFEKGYRMVAGTSNYATIFLKKSPCNFGAGSCYDMLRRFLLSFRSDFSDDNQVEIIYDHAYGGFNGVYLPTSYDAIDEFNQVRGCRASTWNNWYQWYQTTIAAPPPKETSKPTSSGPTAPKPIILPADYKPVKREYVILSPQPTTTPEKTAEGSKTPLARLDNQPAWVSRYFYDGVYQVIFQLAAIPEKLQTGVQDLLRKEQSKAYNVREKDGKINAIAFKTADEQTRFITELAAVK